MLQHNFFRLAMNLTTCDLLEGITRPLRGPRDGICQYVLSERNHFSLVMIIIFYTFLNTCAGVISQLLIIAQESNTMHFKALREKMLMEPTPFK